MNDSQLERIAPLTGVVFVALVVIGALLINWFEYLAPGDELKEFLEDNSTRASIGAYLTVLAPFFLVWFSGSVRATLRRAEGGTGRLSAVAFGGGIVAAGALLVGFTATMAAAQRAGSAGGISPDTAIALLDLNGAMAGTAAAVGFAVLIAATAVIGLRTGIFGSWRAWISAVIAIGLLSPIGYYFVVVALVWVLVVSIALYIKDPTVEPAG